MASQSAMYRAFVEVVPEASGFTGALTGQVAAGSAAAGAAGGKAAGGGFIAGFGKMLPVIGAALGAFALGDVIADSIGNGGDYEQAVGAIEDVFESSANKIIAFSKTSGKAFGLSANQALVGAKDFGIFGRAAGLTGDSLADFSTELLGLGADLSAFANTSPEEAVTAIAAGLRGESEPLRKYGVLLDDVTLKARALALGIDDGEGPLTAQQKILAANAEIFAQTAVQQGKYAAESDTLAGKQAYLAASLENISTNIGTALLPVVTQMVDLFIDHAVPALEDFAGWLNDPATQDGIAKWALGLQQIGDFLTVMSGKFDLGAQQIGGFFNVTAEKFALGAEQWGSFFSAVGGWFQDVADRLALGQQQVFDFFGSIGQKFALGAQQIGAWAGSVGQGVSEVISWFGQLPGRIGDALSGAASWLYSAGQDLIRGLIDGISSMVTDVIGAITDTVGGAIDWAKELLGIASPSKVFMEIGAFTGEGYAQGIASTYRDVQNATSGMTGAAIAGASGMGGVNIHGNVYARDEEELVQRLGAEQRHAMAFAGVN